MSEKNVQTVTEGVTTMYKASPEFMVMSLIIVGILTAVGVLNYKINGYQHEQSMQIHNRLSVIHSNQFILMKLLIEDAVADDGP